jgi:hypothetical protein
MMTSTALYVLQFVGSCFEFVVSVYGRIHFSEPR